jgi:diaminobutyrate-2-oxoglutarate transaminase
MIHGLAAETMPELGNRISKLAFQNGLVIETSGAQDQVLKLLPPLTIDEAHLRDGLDIIEQCVAASLGIEHEVRKKIAFVRFGSVR